MVRVAGSLKLGWVTASLFIAKLQAYPRRNALALALQEYGRLIKTIFILRYLEDETYRRRINTQLNKGEALHALREFLFFANKGTDSAQAGGGADESGRVSQSAHECRGRLEHGIHGSGD